jgi:hypothetical protein
VIGENTIEAIEQELRAACRRRARVETARIPRPSPGIPTLAVLIAVSVAVAVPLLALHSSRTVAPPSAGGFSPAPIAPTPAAIRAAAAACGRLGAPLTGRRVLAAARGRYTALIFVSGKRVRVCISDGHPDHSLVSFDALILRFYLAPGPRQLGLPGSDGGSAPGFAAFASANQPLPPQFQRLVQHIHNPALRAKREAALRRTIAAGQERHVYGLAGKDISTVTFIFATGARVNAIIQHGWYFAWWPSSDYPTSVRVTTTSGARLTSPMTGPGCNPGTSECVFAGTRTRHGHYGAGTYRESTGLASLQSVPWRLAKVNGRVVTVHWRSGTCNSRVRPKVRAAIIETNHVVNLRVLVRVVPMRRDIACAGVGLGGTLSATLNRPLGNRRLNHGVVTDHGR